MPLPLSSYALSGTDVGYAAPRWEGQKRRVRVGVFQDWVSHRPEGTGAGTTATDDAVYKAFERALAGLQAAPFGAEIVGFHMPQMHKQSLSHAFLISSMFSFKLIEEAFKGSSTYESAARDDDLQLATYMQLRIGRKLTAMEVIAARRIRH
eukprot:2402769-Rhodomonas_salina.1